MESTVSRVSKGAKFPSFTAAENRLLHQMVARDESRISRTHRRPALVRLSTLLCKPMSPSHHPIVEGAWIGKQVAHSRVVVGACSRVAQPAEHQGEIDAVAGHALKQVLR